MRGNRIAASGRVDEHRKLVGTANGRRLEAISGFIGKPGGIDVMTFGATHPAFFRQHDGHRLSGHQFVFRQRLGFGAGNDRRTTVITIGFSVGDQLGAHQLAQFGFTAQQRLKLGLLFTQGILLAAQLHLFQTCQLAQAGVEDVVSLNFRETETRNQLRLGMFGGTDDVDHLIQIQVSREQTVQQVQAMLDLVQTKLQTTTHSADTERQPFAEQRLEVLELRFAVQANDVDVDPITGFKLRGREQMLHQFVQLNPVGARDDHDAARVFVVRLVTQVGNHRQFLGLHLRGDLLQHLGTGNLMRQRRDDDIAIFDAVHGTHTHRTTTGFIDFQQVGTRRDDLGFGRIIRPQNMLAQLWNRGLGLVEQMHAGAGNFAQVVRRNISGHADGDTGGAVEQNIRQPCRQHCGLVERAVKVRHPVRGPLTQFAEQHFGVARQARLGVTHGSEGLGIIRRTPVTLPVYQRVAIAERLSHQHHGFVAGRIAVRMELAENITDGTRRLLVLGVGPQAQLAHRVDDAPLYRFQAVADVRQGTVHDHVHGVVEVGLFGEVSQ
ncbi:Uncharacterized protein AC506_0820 [Pseudomonas syringae pv. maculicola str. M6]|nr:Uncharacterized protein AC506_0820 [Pseudomonas syringae pv. maculicola str. M6]